MIERESPKPEIEETRADTLANLLSNAENIPALHGKNFMEVFSSEEGIRSFVEELDGPTLIELISGINGIIQGKDRKDWAMAKDSIPITMGGKGEGLPGYMPPHAYDRNMLFTEALNATKEMLRSKRSLEDVAVMLSGTINAIHAYSDANGRTSRLLYLLLTQGLNKKSDSVINQALSENGRDIVDINPEKIEMELQNALIEKADLTRPIGLWESEKGRNYISFNKNLPDELRTELSEMLADSTYSSIALHKYLNDKPDAEQYLKNYPKQEVRWGGQTKVIPERNNVLVESLFKDLDKTQAREILSIYKRTKAEMVRILIDSAVHPNKAEYTDTDGKTILEKFKQKIERHSEIK